MPSFCRGISSQSCLSSIDVIWAATWQNQQNECAPSEDSDQPGHPPRLIRVFAVRMKKAWVFSYPLSAQWRLRSDWADAQADPSIRWAHTHFVGFVMSWLILFLEPEDQRTSIISPLIRHSLDVLARGWGVSSMFRCILNGSSCLWTGTLNSPGFIWCERCAHLMKQIRLHVGIASMSFENFRCSVVHLFLFVPGCCY